MKPGHIQFAEWMKRRGFSQRETARFLGWHETFISKIVKGSRVPGLASAVKIERHTGIPVKAWMSSSRGKTSQPSKETRGKSAKTAA
jgi:plasmid maintenance system antidote protein VapI